MVAGNDTEVLMKCRDACDKLLALCSTSVSHPALTSATVRMLRDSTAAVEESSTQNRGVMRRFRVPWRRVAWLAVYAITILGLLWWYEVRPIWQAHLALQGDWQFTKGFPPEEQRTDSYFHVNGFNTWHGFPRGTAWHTHESRISLRPARDFYIVRRQYGFGMQNLRETEYVIRLNGDRLYMLRGMARLDPVKTRSIDKLERVDELPPTLQERIETGGP